MTPNRLNRYISQMEAHRRRHTNSAAGVEWRETADNSDFTAISRPRFTKSDEQYAWSNISEGYGGIPQEDHG